MAEQVISPGVFQNENIPVTLEAPVFPEGAAIIGPTVLGPVNIPTVVTTYSEYKQKFGSTFVSGGKSYSFFTSIAAQNYFRQGGQRLLVTRVASGSFESATSTTIGNANDAVSGAPATASITYTEFVNDQELQFTYNSTLFRFIADEGSNIPADVTTGTTQLYFYTSASNVTATTANLRNKLNDSIGWADGNTPSSSLGQILTASAFGTALRLTGSFGLSNTPKSGWGGVQLSTGSGQDLTVAATFAGSVTSVGTNAFTLKTISQGQDQNSSGSESSVGVLASGSQTNLRWEITNADTSSGNFTLVIRQGGDRTSDKRVLETFRGVNLDPRSANFVARRVGSQIKTLEGSGADAYIQVEGEYPNKSKYVVVSNVAVTTPDYLDEDGNVRLEEFKTRIPTNQSGSFTGGTGTIFEKGEIKLYENIADSNTQGLSAGNYSNVIALLKNKDEFPFNVISVPGLYYQATDHASELDNLINNVTSRGDAIIPLDLVKHDQYVSTVTNYASNLNTSYAAAYWPWVKVRDNDLGKNVWVPASTIIPSVYAANDLASDAWFAPAGFNRGALPSVVTTERALNRSLRDSLYSSKVNPIASFPNVGIVVYGQKTLQSKASATDRVNVRRLLIALKKFIGDVSQNLVFEPNTLATRNAFLSVVNPYLETVQQRQGLYGFKVVMDASNNGPQVVDRNELRGAIYLQPTKTAEFIILDFNVLPTGAEFPA